MADQLREKRVELILQQLEELPTLPPVVVKVLQATANDEASARQVVELISSDQSLTTKILQLLHRAGAGVSDEINTVDRAVVLLGFEAVRSMVLAVSVFHTLGQKQTNSRPGVHFCREEFWLFHHHFNVHIFLFIAFEQDHEGYADQKKGTHD